MYPSLRRRLHPAIGEHLPVLRPVQTIGAHVHRGGSDRRRQRRLEGPSQNAIHGLPEDLAPLQRFVPCPSDPEPAQGSSHLKAVVEPVPADEVAVLSRENRSGSQPLGYGCNCTAEGLKWLGHGVTRLALSGQRSLTRRDVHSVDIAM